MAGAHQHSYFDGGNQPDSREYRYATLTVVSGTRGQWELFEKDWRNTLKEHGACYLHTTDAATLNRLYTKDNGWNEVRRDEFLNACVDSAKRHLYNEKPFKTGIFPYTIVVNLYSYARARRKNKEVPQNIEGVLASHALNQSFIWGENVLHAEGYHLIFDQKEPFRGHILDRKNSAKYRADYPTMNKVVSNTEANMRTTPALQLADLFAWCFAHYQETDKPKWHKRVLGELVGLDSRVSRLNYRELIKPIPGTADLYEKWKFPERKPTR